jgi:hypothetical protein
MKTVATIRYVEEGNTMKYTGTVIRIQHSKGGVTLIIETDYGPRGVQIDPGTWAAMKQDAGLNDNTAVVGWRVEYDPAHGDLELGEPDDTFLENED